MDMESKYSGILFSNWMESGKSLSSTFQEGVGYFLGAPDKFLRENCVVKMFSLILGIRSYSFPSCFHPIDLTGLQVSSGCLLPFHFVHSMFFFLQVHHHFCFWGVVHAISTLS